LCLVVCCHVSFIFFCLQWSFFVFGLHVVLEDKLVVW
jgi:hypothetical protein